jgi:hypothetical protein
VQVVKGGETQAGQKTSMKQSLLVFQREDPECQILNDLKQSFHLSVMIGQFIRHFLDSACPCLLQATVAASSRKIKSILRQ